MRTHLIMIIPLVLMSAGMSHAAPAVEEEKSWIPATDPRFEICGLPFCKENEGRLWRMPTHAQGTIPEIVWELGKSPSGARIRFRSDSTSFAIRYTCDKTQPLCNNFSLHGEAGADLYLDDQYVATTIPPATADKEHVLIGGLEKRMRTFCFYLPLYTEVNIESIGLDANAEILPPPPFANPKPVVFYGTSITQGGCAGRAGLSYQAMLCRKLNLDFVNFGFSGSGKGEREVAEVIAEVDASCYVLDFSQNNATADDFEKVYLPFIETLREHRPDTPILCITPIYWAYENYNAEWKIRQERMRTTVKNAVEQRIASGDKAVRVVDGFKLLGPKHEDGLIDGLHPNTLGFYWMAKGLEPEIKTVLHLGRTKSKNNKRFMQ